jgi:stage V sporulation protein G
MYRTRAARGFANPPAHAARHVRKAASGGEDEIADDRQAKPFPRGRTFFKSSHQEVAPMQLTDVRIKLAENDADRLKAFCSLTFDHTFVVRDVKLIVGNDGLFVAMPSRKLTDRCTRCGEKNHLRARFCNGCGQRLDESRFLRYRQGNGAARLKLHADIAHPINADTRHQIERKVLSEYFNELERSKQPGYVAPNLDGEDWEIDPAAIPAHDPSVAPAVMH